MKPFSQRLNSFILKWFEDNEDKFELYSESQFNFNNIDETFKKFTEYYKKYKKIPLWYDNNQDNIFANIVVNGRFRGWHDYCHVLIDADFSLSGEKRVYTYQQSLLPLDWEFERKLMYCEIVKQAEHYSSGGKTIENQRYFTRKYLLTTEL